MKYPIQRTIASPLHTYTTANEYIAMLHNHSLYLSCSNEVYAIEVGAKESDFAMTAELVLEDFLFLLQYANNNPKCGIQIDLDFWREDLAMWQAIFPNVMSIQ